MALTSNITILNDERLSRLAQRIRSAYDRTQHGRSEWIEGTLELASALADGRGAFPADRQFSIWLAENDLDLLSANDRAALIKLAEEPSRLRDILIEQEIELAPDTIWRKYQHRFGKRSKPEVDGDLSQSASMPVAIEPEQPISPEVPAKNKVEIEPISNRHPFRALQKGEEIAAIYLHSKTRSTIGTAVKKRREIWSLILQVYEAGLLRPTGLVIDQPDLGILFPESPRTFRKRYDLTKPKDLKSIKEEILPAVLVNRSAVFAAPQKIDEIIKDYAERLRLKAEAERYAQKVEMAKSNIKPTETEVVIFGRRLWPIVDLAHPDLAYNFEELRRAVWTFRELYNVCRLTPDNSPQSCGIRIRHIIKFLSGGYLNSKLMFLITDMSRALQENPNGEEKLPNMPDLDRSGD